MIAEQGYKSGFTPRVKRVLSRAGEIAKQRGDKFVNIEHLIAAIKEEQHFDETL